MTSNAPFGGLDIDQLIGGGGAQLQILGGGLEVPTGDHFTLLILLAIFVFLFKTNVHWGDARKDYSMFKESEDGKPSCTH